MRKTNAQPSVTTYYIYDGEKPILEYSGGAIVARNVYGKWIDEILMRTDPAVNGGAPFYYHQDRNHNVTHLTNAIGAVIEKYKYDAFGAVTVYDGSGNLRPNGTFYKNRFLFTGREYAATFGFYEYRARAYNPVMGRFMSEDPKGFDAGDYNLFRYCQNDPLDRVDPMGLGDEAVNAQMVKVGYVNLPMHVGSHIPPLAPVFVPAAALVEAKALGGLNMGQVEGKAKQGVTLRERYRRMNEEKLAGLDQRFAPMARHFVVAANSAVNPEGLEVRISHGTRSLAEQAELYRKLAGKGVAPPGRSAHNYGMAIDIAVIRGSAEVNRPATWARLGRLGESLGLRWGHGFDDDDHFQHPGIPTRGTQLLRLHSHGRDVLTGEPLEN